MYMEYTFRMQFFQSGASRAPVPCGGPPPPGIIPLQKKDAGEKQLPPAKRTGALGQIFGWRYAGLKQGLFRSLPPQRHL
jgi:hypothetical protein